MALSVNKIVASRSRRGGISLHRNLLVAGVLFRARDALLAVGKMPSLSSSSSSSPSSGSPAAPEKQRPQPDQMAEDRNCNTVPSASAPNTEMPMQQSQPEAHSESAAPEIGAFQGQESATTDAESNCMDIEVVGKENVPPSASASTQPPTVTPNFSKAEVEEAKACDENLKQNARKRRCSESSTTSCPIANKSAKTCTSSSPSSTSVPSVVAVDSRTRSSSVPACNGRPSSSRVASNLPKTTSASVGSSSVAFGPVVYLNRVDVALCSTPSIMGSVRPVLVVQVV